MQCFLKQYHSLFLCVEYIFINFLTLEAQCNAVEADLWGLGLFWREFVSHLRFCVSLSVFILELDSDLICYLILQVWDLTVHNLLYSFPSDRSKATRFRSSGVAVSELYLGPGAQLFSSSAEGTLKFRHLTLKHATVLSCQNDDRGNCFTQF